MQPVDLGGPDGEIVADEQRLLARVSTALSQLNIAQTGAPDYDSALIDLRDRIAEAKPEDLAALVGQMTRISAIAQRYGRGRTLPVNPESPYFAHLRLAESVESKDILIGKYGFIDRTQNIHIVDWRHAPVSRIYYRYQEGDDYEERFGSRDVGGVVQARRALTIDEGKLGRISCPQGLFVTDPRGTWFKDAAVGIAQLSGGRGKAVRPPKLKPGGQGSRLGSSSPLRLRADKHLPEVAALIDPVQFELITQPESGLVVLQGGAGTGKTTVALHRVAFLNFQRPAEFRPEKILIVVPGEAMSHYIGRVLPALGVKGVQVSTSAAWLMRQRRRIVRDKFSGYSNETPPAVLRLKKHPLMLKLAVRFVRAQAEEMERQLRQAMHGRPQAERVLDIWQEYQHQPLCVRLNLLRNWLRQDKTIPIATRQQVETSERIMAQRAQDIRSDWAEMLTDLPLLKALTLAEAPGEFSERDLQVVCEWCLRQSEEVAPREETALDNDDDEDEDRETPYISVDGIDERISTTAGYLDAPDDGLLIYLSLLKWGILRSGLGKKPIGYDHVVVDEAQDLTAVELKLLVTAAGERRSVTLAGDTAQRIVFDNGFATWERLLELLDVPVSSNTTLRLGYRSTAEVMSLAQSFIETGAPAPQSFRQGTPVELLRFPDQGQAVALLAEALRSLMLREPLASVALITRYPAQARGYAEALTCAEVPAVRWVAQQDFTFKPGIEVVDVAQVKGLEFDYVILLDVNSGSYPSTLESRHLLHIAATRAVHQLWLICTGIPSPLLPSGGGALSLTH